MKTIEVKAKSVVDAIEDACEQLGVSQDDLIIEVLAQGGMFGKAKIKATIKESAEIKAPEPEPKKPEPRFESTPETTEIEIGSSEVTPRFSKKSEKNSADATARTADGEIRTPKNGTKFEICTKFVTKLLELLENDSTVSTEETDAAFNINVAGENIGRLIGKGGSALNALQTLVSSVAISNANGEPKRVFVNVGDYKEKRGDTLQTLAMKKAEFVKRTGRFVKFEPMNARDRAIIHSTLQSVEGIKTYSTGKDPFRCLCIAPADGTTPKPDTAENA
jgi:spoIIIJ-associated protein